MKKGKYTIYFARNYIITLFLKSQIKIATLSESLSMQNTYLLILRLSFIFVNH